MQIRACRDQALDEGGLPAGQTVTIITGWGPDGSGWRMKPMLLNYGMKRGDAIVKSMDVFGDLLRQPCPTQSEDEGYIC